MKKVLLLVMSFSLIIALTLPATLDAKRGGGYKSPKRTYTESPSKSTDNVNKSQPGTTKSGTAGTTAGTAGAANRGFFSGGSLAKGLMIGGIAGLLFGGMFANMGGFGDFLGLLINVLAIYILFKAVRGIYRYYQAQRRINPNDPYNQNRR
jgi:predicted lipid-binding transport protein (Tim44 family)